METPQEIACDRSKWRERPDYDASKGQLVCPHCGLDCGGWCEPGDHLYDGEDS